MTPTSTPSAAAMETQSTLQRNDPVLTELWETKAKMNAEAGYDPQQLLANAHKEVQALRTAGLLPLGHSR